MSSLTLVVLIATHVLLVSARNDTLIHGWVPEPHGRGTWSILWSCLATIVICTWSSLHLAVPKRHGFWYLLFRKLRHMTVSLLAPELTLGIAAENFFHARSVLIYLAENGNLQWNLTQLLFLEAGGYWIKPDLECDRKQLLKLVENNRIDGPPLSEEELKSRGKSDVFVKLLFVLQITWFLLQTLVRAILHYQTTAFEIMTVAFVFCSLATIGFSMKQPQNVEYPVFLEVRDAAPAKEESEQRQNPDESSHGQHSDEESQNPTRRRLKSRLSIPLKYQETWVTQNTHKIILVLFACGFGAIHCLAWNSPFPTPEERLVWRICASTTTGLPVLVLVLLEMHDLTSLDWLYMVVLLLIVPYILGRITIIVLALMSFRASPADAFKTVQWNQYFPHFAS